MNLLIGIGLGAILSQKDADGKQRVVAYASRTVRQAEVNAKYIAMELELLALKWAVTEIPGLSTWACISSIHR